MPPRVAFWTSAFEPEMEGISAEVSLLRRHFPGSITWGLTHRHWLLFSPARGFCCHPRLHLLFRLGTWLFEPAFQINHVLGSIGDWFYLQSEKRRPTILTVATESPPVPQDMLRRVDRFVVEYPDAAASLRKLGVSSERIEWIPPPVDLKRFSPAPPPAGPFTVLFASSPEKESWLEARGVPQLLAAAKLRPRMHFRFLWRPWGDAEPAVRRLIAEQGLRNVEVVSGLARDMARHYRAAHVCVAPFREREKVKPAPNSIVESLACGRPVLVTPAVGLAELIAERGGGVVASSDASSLAEALDRLQADWNSYTQAARRLAEEVFGQARFVERYRIIYNRVLQRRSAPVPGCP